MTMDSTQLKDTNAYYCLECGKCTGVCPVARYSGTFSPRRVLSQALYSEQGDAGIWSCLTCGHCEEVCPSNIDFDRFIRIERRAVGVEHREGSCSHGGIIESISRLMTMDNLQQNRLDWLDRSMVSEKSEYLFFTGCLPYFEVLFEDIDAAPLNIARSTLQILNHLGIKPRVLANERCCGHDFFWSGDHKMFEQLVHHNQDMIENSGAGTVVTACPECFRALKHDYPDVTGKRSFEVMHISELIDRHRSELRFNGNNGGKTYTYQDPCRLGRHMSVYEAPRAVLNAIPGTNFREMAHHGRRATCCGVSGWMNCSQISKNIQTDRLREARRSGADTMVTACVKCKIHFNCAMRDQTLSDEVNLRIMDLTEVVAEHLKV